MLVPVSQRTNSQTHLLIHTHPYSLLIQSYIAITHHQCGLGRTSAYFQQMIIPHLGKYTFPSSVLVHMITLVSFSSMWYCNTRRKPPSEYTIRVQ